MAPARSCSLAIAACCAICGNVFAQALPPLRVDPGLLGLGAPKPPATGAVPPPAEAVTPGAAPTATPPATITPPAVTPAAPAVTPLAETPSDKAALPPAAPAKANRPGKKAKKAPGPRRDPLAPATAATEGLAPATPDAPPRASPPSLVPARPEQEPRRATTELAPEARVAAAPQPPAALPPARRPADASGAEPEATPPLGLRLARTLQPLPPKSSESVPVFITADRLTGANDRESVAEGDVELRQAHTVVQAEKMTYRHADDELVAEQDVRLIRDQSVISGPRLRLRVEEQVGEFERPAYSLRHTPKPTGQQATVGALPVPAAMAAVNDLHVAAPRKAATAHGNATLIEFQGENQYQLTDATYSTCKPGDNSWFAKVAGLHLDYDREVADGRDATVYFKGVPILYTPWLSFSLNNQRKSGVLPPTVGSTSQSGMELTVPYYWNIAPNMDATIAPRIFSKRGTQISSEFRYLSEPYNGTIQAEWLPGDKVRNIDRWGYSVQHAQNFGHGLAGNLNVNGVSDDFYYKDLSSRIANSAQTQLLRQGGLSYSADWWSANAQMTRYQTLQSDPANPVARPYEITPQLTLSARRTFLDRVDFSLLGQYTDFTHPDASFLQAKRTVLYPQLSLPIVTPAFYVTPKIGAHVTRYGFDRPLAGGATSFSRSLPIASVDAGLVFERSDSLLGRAYTQTLEPRLYYLYVPNRDQSLLVNNRVNFDTGITDFNFAQIFSENVFSGQDRIADANQLTAAVTSRFLNPETGGEYFKAMLGQRLYFDSQSVTLNPGDARRTSKKTDLLAAATGQVTPEVHVDAAWQYNPSDHRTERFNIGTRFVPEAGRFLNAAFRFGRNQAAPFEVNVKQLDFSGQWPIVGGWQAVGRFNYSIHENRVIETIAGLEYNSGCWAARFVVQRFATTVESATSAVFLQLELADFSRIGSNPLELLKRSIPGYGRADQPAADPVFGTQ